MSSKLTLWFYLRSGKKSIRKDGTTAIFLRITIDGEKSVVLPTKQTCPKSLWSGKKQRLKGTTTAARSVNLVLDKIESEIRDLFLQHVLKKKRITAEQLRDKYQGKDKEKNTLLSLFDVLIAEKEQELAQGIIRAPATVGRYKETKRKVAEFIKLKYKFDDLYFDEIPPKIATDFEKYLLLELGLSTNGAIKPQQILKAVVDLAHAEGKMSVNPHHKYKIKRAKSHREVLSMSEIVRLLEYQSENATLCTVRDMFLVAIFTGLAFTDVMSLKKKEILQYLGSSE